MFLKCCFVLGKWRTVWDTIVFSAKELRLSVPWKGLESSSVLLLMCILDSLQKVNFLWESPDQTTSLVLLPNQMSSATSL